MAFTQDVETEFFEPYLSNAILFEDRELTPENLEIFRKFTLKGDPTAAYMYTAARDYPEMFGVNPNDPQLFLSNDQISEVFLSVERKLDRKTLEVMFLSQTDLLKQINQTPASLAQYLDAIFLDAQKISADLFESLASRLLNVILDKYGHPSPDYTAPLSIPDELATKVLSLTILSGGDLEWFKFPLMMRVYSAREMNAIHSLGYKEYFTEEMPQDADMRFVYLLSNLENILHGNDYHFTGFSFQLIEELNELALRFPELPNIYVKYFPAVEGFLMN